MEPALNKFTVSQYDNSAYYANAHDDDLFLRSQLLLQVLLHLLLNCLLLLLHLIYLLLHLLPHLLVRFQNPQPPKQALRPNSQYSVSIEQSLH